MVIVVDTNHGFARQSSPLRVSANEIAAEVKAAVTKSESHVGDSSCLFAFPMVNCCCWWAIRRATNSDCVHSCL